MSSRRLQGECHCAAAGPNPSISAKRGPATAVRNACHRGRLAVLGFAMLGTALGTIASRHGRPIATMVVILGLIAARLSSG